MTRQIEDRGALEAALESPRFLLFKHSRVCPVSSRAFTRYEEFVRDNPDVQTGWIDVIGQRQWSQWVAAEYGVEHKSPQALLFQNGQVVWHQSHREITPDSLADALAPRNP